MRKRVLLLGISLILVLNLCACGGLPKRDMSNKFLNYYGDLIDAGYVDGNKCDFECFIYNCNFQDYLEDNSFYIEDNHLILYKYFNTYNKYNYDGFFTDESYRFVVK